MNINLNLNLTLNWRRNEQDQNDKGRTAAQHEPTGDAAGQHHPIPQEGGEQASLPGTYKARRVTVPEIAVKLAYQAIENGDSLDIRKQYDHLAGAYGHEVARLAWRVASDEYDDIHADDQLWDTTTAEYELTDDDCDYIHKRMHEDGILHEDIHNPEED